MNPFQPPFPTDLTMTGEWGSMEEVAFQEWWNHHIRGLSSYASLPQETISTVQLDLPQTVLSPFRDTTYGEGVVETSTSAPQGTDNGQEQVSQLPPPSATISIENAQRADQATELIIATGRSSATAGWAPYEAISHVDKENEGRTRGATKDRPLPNSTADDCSVEKHDDESRSIGSSQATFQEPGSGQEIKSMTASPGRRDPVADGMYRRYELKACTSCGRPRFEKAPMSLDTPLCTY
jgi:hypothetical protein